MMRNDLLQALAHCHENPCDDAYELLQDLIESAILDSFDLDWTASTGAKAVMKALFDFDEEENDQ